MTAGAQDLNTIEDPHEAHFPQDIDTPSDDFHQDTKPNKANHHLHSYLGSREITAVRELDLAMHFPIFEW